MNSGGATAVAHRPTSAAGRSRESAEPTSGGAGRFALSSPVVVVGLVWLVLLAPLLVALGVLRDPHWYPIGDLAQTELRVRDVFSNHVPLIGLAGRLGTLAQQGSHPGPMSFWILWPFYRLFGASSAALQAAAVAVQYVAVGGSLVLAYRRGGARLTLGVGAALAVLLHAYGTPTIVEAWNPYMPVMWWFLFLMAVWSVVCDDVAMLPVAVFAGSFCLQTHISYLGLIGGSVLLLVAATAWAARKRRGDGAALRSLLRWGGVALALGVVLWLPPVIEQLTSSPGNLSIIYDTFRDPPEAPIGLTKGVELQLLQLNPWRLATGTQGNTGSTVPGIVVLCAWTATAVLAWRRRWRTLLRLDLVLAAAVALGVVSLSRIYGTVWPYLMLWTWGICALVLLATAWAVGLAVGRRAPDSSRPALARLANVGMAAVLVVASGALLVDATSAEVPAPRLSRTVGQLADPVQGALDSGSVPGGGKDGRYLVTWTDPVAIGTQGVGLLLELERRGFDVGVPKSFREGVARHRAIPPSQVTGTIHLSVGPDIAVWRAKPEAREVAYVDNRTPAEQARYTRLRGEAIDDFRAAGRNNDVAKLDGGLLPLAVAPETPPDASQKLAEMLDIGLPVAVFVAPPGTS